MTVEITGASSGTGRELAAGYAFRASRLYLIARRAKSLEEMANELCYDKTIIKTFSVDVTDFETQRATCQATQSFIKRRLTVKTDLKCLF